MHIITEFRPLESGADIILATSAENPQWAIMRWDQENFRLSGYVGQPNSSGIAMVSPVKMTHNLNAEESVGMMALLAFLSVAKIQATDQSFTDKNGLSSQVDIWESFLGDAPSEKSKSTGEEYVRLTKEQSFFITSNGLASNRAGVITPRRNASLKTGSPISGFDAMRIQKSVSRVIGSIPVPPPVDIQAARKALAGVARPSPQAVTWYGTLDEDRKTDRAQAAASFPVLAGMIADNPIMARAVDSREALQPLLIERTGLSKGALRRIGKLSSPLPASRIFEDGPARGEDALGVNRLRRFTVSGAASLDMALKHLAELPPDRTPQDDRSWQIYHDILAGCAIPLENALGIPCKTTLEASKGDWIGFHAILAKAADFDPEVFDRRSIALTTTDALEATEDLSRSAILPMILGSIQAAEQEIPPVTGEYFRSAFDIAGRIMTGQSKNVAAGLFEMARRYSSRIPALMEATGFVMDDGSESTGDERFARYGSDSFPALVDEYAADNGLVVRPLDTFDKMTEESRRLSHCVGRFYQSRARMATTHLFSVQNESGTKSFSTVELSSMRGDTARTAAADLRVVQHRAENNGNPPESAMEAVAEWERKIRDAEIPIAYDEVTAWRNHLAQIGQDKPKAAPTVSWTGGLGMDWTEEARRRNAWQEWRGIIGGSWGKSESPEVIWRDKGARDLVASMSPMTASLLEERARLQREEQERQKAEKAAAKAAAAESPSP